MNNSIIMLFCEIPSYWKQCKSVERVFYEINNSVKVLVTMLDIERIILIGHYPERKFRKFGN